MVDKHVRQHALPFMHFVPLIQKQDISSASVPIRGGLKRWPPRVEHLLHERHAAA